MLYIFCGSDVVKVRKKAHDFLRTREERGTGVEYISPEQYADGMLSDLAGGTSLFAGEQMIILDTFSESKEAWEALLSHADMLGESANIFMVMEGKILAADAKKLKKHAKEFHEIQSEVKKDERFNAFALADALVQRDKKSLWVLLEKAKAAGLSSEEIIGTLFWQIKSMRLATKTENAEEAGIKPFVYSKSKRGAAQFKEYELYERSHDLVLLYHQGHSGEADIDIALERWVLGL